MTPEVATNLLEIALAKCTTHREQVWVGYLTAPEQKMLVDLGAKLGDTSMYDWLQSRAREGIVRRGWFYFEATGKLKDLLSIINGHGRHKK